MAEDTLLSDELLRQLMSVGEVDLLVGISSQCAAGSVADAVRAIEQGLPKHFVRSAWSSFSWTAETRARTEL